MEQHEEGGQQGSSIASAGFQLALHPTACELDAKLRAADPDTCARFISDDGTLAAPLAALPDILDWLEDALATRLGCELQRAKCACYCPDLGARLADDPDFAHLGVKLGRFERPDGRRVRHGIERPDGRRRVRHGVRRPQDQRSNLRKSKNHIRA